MVTFILTEIASKKPGLTERLYSEKLYPVIAGNLSKVSFFIPFSVDDLFYMTLILFSILLIILLAFRKISLTKTGKIVLNIVAICYTLFYFLWGFNYFRPNLNQRLNLEIRQPNLDEFLDIFRDLVIQTNKTYTSFDKFEKVEIDSLVEQSYDKLAPVLGLNYPLGSRFAKDITFSRFFAKAGISGYYGPFFNEVHVNTFNLPVEYPFVLAHEKAHQFGITSEAEANFYAWLVCSQSSSDKLQYSANLVVLQYFANQGYQLEGFSEIVQQLDEPVKNDLRRIREHWTQLRNEKIDRAAAKINDAYLKTNKVEKGIEDYHGVVKFVMEFELDSAFQKKWNLK